MKADNGYSQNTNDGWVTHFCHDLLNLNFKRLRNFSIKNDISSYIIFNKKYYTEVEMLSFKDFILIWQLFCKFEY